MVDLTTSSILLLAFLIDAACGDPPNALHPVVWMGRYIAWSRRHTTATHDLIRLSLGVVVVVAGVIVVAAIGLGIQYGCRSCPWWVVLIIQASILKCTLSIRSLARAATSVRDRLSAGDLESARQQVAYHLVSRDVTQLNASEIAAATIESVAENTSDSFVAPLFYFVIAGLPGALVYRFVNTCDAMLGYRTQELEWFGKPAARLDDAMNLIPSRLTAALMLVVYGIYAKRFRAAVRIWMRDHPLTASPNAGHPMSAAAGVLGVVLIKQGHYRLGGEQPLPDVKTIENSIQLLWFTGIAATVIAFVLILTRELT